MTKQNEKDAKRVPELRFKGFTDDWEQRKLGEIAEEVKGNSGSINNIPILTISAANGWMNQKDRFSQIIAGNELKKYTLLKKGELSYNHGNSKLAKYGTVFVQDSHDQALVPRVYHSFKMVAQNNPYFIEYLFASGLPNKELSKIVTSGARMDGLLNINKKEFFSIKLNNPSSEEQSKIAKLFQSLDKTITLHEEKHRQLEQLKKALLQKMFADETGYSALRFKGFTEKWEQKKLGNIIRQSSLKNNNYNYPILTSAHEGLVPQSAHFGSQQRHDTSDYNVIKPNQITYRNRSDDGRFTFNINKLNIMGLVSKFYPVFSFENTDNDFMVNNLNNNPQIKYDLDMLSVGTGQQVLSFTNLKKYEILAPSYVEQKRIGQLLLQLDKTITLHDKKIQYLKQLKRGLLQKMFV